MPKAYWIARVDVADPERYQDYVATAGPAFKEFGGRFLARGGPYVALEGPARARNVVIEFESMDAAQACYDSATYAKAKAHRGGGVAAAEIVLVEGLE